MKLLRIILVLQVLNSLNGNVFSQISPNQLTGLIGWYNSQNTINNGVSISQLTDLSGNNFHLSQANSLKRPNLIGNSLGNFPSIAFDEPGAAQAHRHHQEGQLHGHLHQPDPHEDRRHVRFTRNHHRRQRAQVLRFGASGHSPHRQLFGAPLK